MTREEAREALSVLKIYDAQWLREAVDMAIEALQEVQKHEETFEWCTECKEYDKDNHCCHRWSKTIRNTVEELKTDRPHGEWIKKQVFNHELDKYVPLIECSVCGYEPYYGGSEAKFNYCANCGAIMEK